MKNLSRGGSKFTKVAWLARGDYIPFVHWVSILIFSPGFLFIHIYVYLTFFDVLENKES
jgi:hypothetical protein